MIICLNCLRKWCCWCDFPYCVLCVISEPRYPRLMTSASGWKPSNLACRTHARFPGENRPEDPSCALNQPRRPDQLSVGLSRPCAPAPGSQAGSYRNLGRGRGPPRRSRADLEKVGIDYRGQGGVKCGFVHERGNRPGFIHSRHVQAICLNFSGSTSIS